MKRPSLIAIAVLATATSCASSGSSVDHATLDQLAYSVPSGWQRHDLSDLYTKRVEWTPRDNLVAKESVVIMRSSPRPALAKAAPGYVDRLLDQAQAGLPKGSFSKARRFVTKNGFVGVRVEGSFVPHGQTQPYQRVHAVVIDGTSFVHVLSTGRDLNREAFDVVIDSLQRKDS